MLYYYGKLLTYLVKRLKRFKMISLQFSLSIIDVHTLYYNTNNFFLWCNCLSGHIFSFFFFFVVNWVSSHPLLLVRPQFFLCVWVTPLLIRSNYERYNNLVKSISDHYTSNVHYSYTGKEI